MRDQDRIVKKMAAKFKYRWDTEQYKLRDAWFIMEENDKGKLEGDCEDFALTLLYKLKGESLFKFWLSLIIRESKICGVEMDGKICHAVLYYRGEYADNWTRKFVNKDVINANGFTFNRWMFTPIQVAFKMLYGKIKAK